MNHFQFTVLNSRGVVRVAGPAAHDFLQNLVTADLEDIDSNGSGFGALLTPQGKILFDFLIFKEADYYLLDTPREILADLVKRLTFYRLRAKVEIEDISDNMQVIAAWGATLEPNLPGVATIDPRVPELGHRILGNADTLRTALTSQRAAEVGEADYSRHRISLGVPESLADYMFSDIFPHDADMDQLNGVSFSKGCYVGQEVVSRVHHRGTARKRFISVSSAEPLPEPGTPITVDGKIVGTLGTSARMSENYAGLALVRLDKVGSALDNGSPLMCGSSQIAACLPTWASFTWPASAVND